MSIHHKILSNTRLLQRIARKLGVRTGFVPNKRLRVLIYHDIPVAEHDKFYKQLSLLKKSWNIITPQQFESMMLGQCLVEDDNLLITFDDGLISNRVVAEKILNPLDIKALFFVISDFVGIDDDDEARVFIANNIIPGEDVKNIPKQWKNMQWTDLDALLEQGHTIGGHTKQHSRLSLCSSEHELEEEIKKSADIISHRLGVDIEHFAYTFGDIGSINEAALLVAKQRFKYIYSGLRGNNAIGVSPFALRRDAAAFQLPNNEYVLFDNNLLESFLGGYADFKYKKPSEMLDLWS